MPNFDRRSAQAVAVPFEGSELLGTKIRGDERYRFVALLLDFARSGSTYVLPWGDLPKAFSLGQFDAGLHATLSKCTYVSPADIQSAASDLHASGAGGPLIQRQELLHQAQEEERQIRLVEIIGRRLFTSIGLHLDDVRRRRDARRKLVAACLDHGLQPEGLARKLEVLTLLASPIGLTGLTTDSTLGPLRRETGQLVEIARHFRYRAGLAATRTEDASHYVAAAKAADHAHQAAASLVAHIDHRLSAIVETLSQWNQKKPEIEAAMEQLRSVLDGWSTVFAAHAGALELPSGASINRPAAITSMIGALPGRPLWQPCR